MASMTQLRNLPPHLHMTVVTMNYRSVVGKSECAFDPAVYASELLGAGDPKGSLAERLQIELLTKNLQDIAAVRGDVAAKLRRRLTKNTGSLSNYIGWRMEARIASSLSRGGVHFDYDDAPDFAIQHAGENVAIECTSIHVDENAPPDKDLGYKITSAVRKKGQMAYADGSLAVAIDISGINKVRQGKSVDRAENNELVAAASADSLAGSVLLFTTGFMPSSGDLWFTYSRHDTRTVSVGLKSFLDLQYPVRPGMVRSPIFFA